MLLNELTNAQLCLMNLVHHLVMFKHYTKLGCAVEMDTMVVLHEDPEGDEQGTDMYWRDQENWKASETLKMCSIQMSNGQKTDLVMEDLAAADPGDKDNSEPVAAAGLPDVLVAIKSRKEWVEVSDISSSKHDVVTGLLGATVVSQMVEPTGVGDMGSSAHKVVSGSSYMDDLTSCTLEEGCQEHGCLLRAPNNQQSHGLGSCQNIYRKSTMKLRRSRIQSWQPM